MKRMLISVAISICISFGPVMVTYAQEPTTLPSQMESVESKPHVKADQTVARISVVKYIVIVSKTDVRTAPRSTAESVGYLYKDDILSVVEVKDGWAQIRINGQKRYVDAGHLQKK